jgi:murein L,D-transpeptidase YcbB/YkuD
MKTLLRITAIAVFIAGSGFPVLAERSDAPGSTLTASISKEGSDKDETKPLAEGGEQPTVAELVHGVLNAGSDEEDEEALGDQSLRAFYAGSSAKALWVDENGANARARAAAEEIARAGAFGLDPGDYKLPDAEGIGKTNKARAKFELALTRAVLKYAHDAKAGRIHPSRVRHTLNDPEGLKDTRGFLQALRDDDVKDVLRGLHPRHPQFKALVKKLAELRGGSGEKPRIQIPDGPVLKPGMTHEHVALLRKRLEIEGAGGADAETFDDAVEQAVKAFQKSKGLKQDSIVGNNTRHAMNGESNEQLVVRILANMERWRWLPDDMDGDAGIYVWTNIPEFRVRVVDDGKVAFNERVIVGKTDKQTPVFSDEMEWIELHPTWYVPMSIMVEDIGPSLKRPTSTVMERYHLQLNCGSHGRDWKKIDWNKVSIRSCSVSQPPGDKSVLGDFKFKFPNRHDVYMHDTPTKRLFNASVRTFSHGCMRIRNPRRMAEILLAHDKGMSSERIGEILAGPKRLHKEDLTKHVPVHMTYFTVVFDEDGGMQTFGDVYGHDRRLAQALTGKGHLLPVPAVAVSKKRKPVTRTRTARDGVWSNAFTAN